MRLKSTNVNVLIHMKIKHLYGTPITHLRNRRQYSIISKYEGGGVCKENSSLRYRRLHTFTICTVLDNFEKKTNLYDCIMI